MYSGLGCAKSACGFFPYQCCMRCCVAGRNKRREGRSKWSFLLLCFQSILRDFLFLSSLNYLPLGLKQPFVKPALFSIFIYNLLIWWNQWNQEFQDLVNTKHLYGAVHVGSAVPQNHPRTAEEPIIFSLNCLPSLSRHLYLILAFYSKEEFSWHF